MANFSKKYYFYEFYYDRFYYLCTRKMKRVWMFCMHLCIWKSNFCIKPK